MARKFVERENSTTLNLFDGPEEYDKDAITARIAEIDDILDDPDYKKQLMVAGTPNVTTEAEFDALFENERDQLGSLADFYSSATVTVVESFDAVDHRWMSPSDLFLAPGTIESVCGEEAGKEAVNAIDGTGTTNWQHDIDHEHEITVDLGLLKRISGIRVINSAAPAGPLQLSGVQVYVAGTVAKLADAASHVGVDLAFTDPLDNDRDLTARNGRFVKVTIGSTGHADNHVTMRELELRFIPQTAAL